MSDRDTSHPHDRHSRVFTGSKPVFFLLLAVACAVSHHVINTKIDGLPVDFMTSKIEILGYHPPKLSQKSQHWVLNLFAFLYKSFLVRSMSYGLLQHAWRTLRYTPFTVPQIDCVVALQHRKVKAFWKAIWELIIFSCPLFCLHALIATFTPYVAAILPSGSLTIVRNNNDAYVYAYDWQTLFYPYFGGLLVAFLLLLFGTHSLAVHNPTNMNFSFSHLLSATRNTVFDDLLGQASRHHAPAKVLQNLEGLVYTEVKGTAREAFQSVQDDFGA